MARGPAPPRTGHVRPCARPRPSAHPAPAMFGLAQPCSAKMAMAAQSPEHNPYTHKTRVIVFTDRPINDMSTLLSTKTIKACPAGGTPGCKEGLANGSSSSRGLSDCSGRAPAAVPATSPPWLFQPPPAVPAGGSMVIARFFAPLSAPYAPQGRRENDRGSASVWPTHGCGKSTCCKACPCDLSTLARPVCA